jgi:hypothetical protein
LRSWSVLREKLLSEIRCRLSVADVHRQLSSRRKRADETLLQYLYKIQEIVTHDNIEDEWAIDYVCDLWYPRYYYRQKHFIKRVNSERVQKENWFVRTNYKPILNG